MTTATTTASKSEPTITMTRALRARQTAVWEAISESEQVARWFGGEGFTSPVCQMDVRPGGAWRHVMRSREGMEFAIDSIFVEVKSPERLVWKSAKDLQQYGGPPSMEQTVTLEACGDLTIWTLVARYATIVDRDVSESMGFSSMIAQSLDRLDRFVASA